MPTLTSPSGSEKLVLLMLLVSIGSLAFIFTDGLIDMEYRWASMEQYSYGYMVPLVAFFLLWQKLVVLRLDGAGANGLVSG
jgi:hypothetical protein